MITKENLMESIMAVFKELKELDLADKEIQFISAVACGYVFSPLDVRLKLMPKFQNVVREAVEMIHAESGKKINNDGGDWN
jgi:hypothetical protein